MIKYIKDFIHYLIIYIGINLFTYHLLLNKFKIDLYSNFLYEFILIFISVFLGTMIINWYKLKE